MMMIVLQDVNNNNSSMMLDIQATKSHPISCLNSQTFEVFSSILAMQMSFSRL